MATSCPFESYPSCDSHFAPSSQQGKRLGGDTARRVDLKWPKRHSMPQSVTLGNKTKGFFSQGSCCLGTGWASSAGSEWWHLHHLFPLPLSFIKLHLSQPKQFLTFSFQFSSPSHWGRGSKTVETSLAVQGQPTTHIKVQLTLRKEQSLNLTVLKKYHLHTEITKHGSSLKWFWLYMILHLLRYFFPQQKRVITLYYTVMQYMKAFAFLLKARNMRSCSGSQVQWTETRMQLLWKGWYLSKLLYPESAFAKLSRNQTHRVVLPICGRFYNVVLRKLLVLIQEAFLSKTGMFEGIMPLPEKEAFLQCHAL